MATQGWNSVTGLQKDSVEAVQEAQGVTRFYGEHGYVHISAGIIKQGNIVARANELTITVLFNEAFPKQVLNLQISPAVSEFTLNGLEGFSVPVTGGVNQFFYEATGI